MSFSFIHIPQDDLQPLVEVEKSKSGGLENDELQAYAKAHLKTDYDGHASMESISGHMKSIGQDMSLIDEKYKDAIFGMGTTLDIVTLQCPSVKNNWVGVSLYCDANGIAKEFKPNTRATRLAQACGHTVVINGDAFLGRIHDNEALPWERLSITIAEADVDAAWVRDCAIDNKGRNLQKYTSSGAFSSAMTSVNNYDDPFQPNNRPKPLDQEINDAKSIKVHFKSSSLKVELPNTEASEGSSEGKLLGPSGAELYGPIHSSECTWSLDTQGSGKVLVITLAKADSLRWLKLLK